MRIEVAVNLSLQNIEQRATDYQLSLLLFCKHCIRSNASRHVMHNKGIVQDKQDKQALDYLYREIFRRGNLGHNCISNVV